MYATIDSPSHALTVLDGVRRTLAETVDLDQLKTYRDEAEAIRQLLKNAAVGLEMQNKAAEVKLLAERQIGGILKRLHLHGGDRKSNHRGKGTKLEGFGISRTQSARWQREASLPEEDFREYLRQTRLEGRELTSVGLLRAARLYARSAPPIPSRTAVLATSRSVSDNWRGGNRSSPASTSIRPGPTVSRHGRIPSASCGN